MAQNDRLTDKQEAFVAGLLQGMSQRAAYRAAYDAERMSDNTVDQCACRLLASPKIAARLEELQGAVRAEAETANVASAVEVLEELSKIAMGRTAYPAYNRDGDEVAQFPAVRDRTKALELLGKHHMLFADKMELSGGITVGALEDFLRQNDSKTVY